MLIVLVRDETNKKKTWLSGLINNQTVILSNVWFKVPFLRAEYKKSSSKVQSAAIFLLYLIDIFASGNWWRTYKSNSSPHANHQSTIQFQTISCINFQWFKMKSLAAIAVVLGAALFANVSRFLYLFFLYNKLFYAQIRESKYVQLDNII